MLTAGALLVGFLVGAVSMWLLIRPRFARAVAEVRRQSALEFGPRVCGEQSQAGFDRAPARDAWAARNQQTPRIVTYLP